MKYFSILLVTIFFLQCTGNQQTSTVKEPETIQEEVVPTETTTTPAATAAYPSITAEKMRYLWDNCDYVDFIFYETNFSMSQNDQNAIRSTLSGVSTAVADVRASCKPVGRVFFQVDGQNASEADLFFGGECLYYIFLENGTYAYANQLTEGGFNFYKNIFEQVSTQAAPE